MPVRHDAIEFDTGGFEALPKCNHVLERRTAEAELLQEARVTRGRSAATDQELVVFVIGLR